MSTIRFASVFMMVITALSNPVTAFGMIKAQTALPSIADPATTAQHRLDNSRSFQLLRCSTDLRKTRRTLRADTSTQLASSVPNIIHFRGGGNIVTGSAETVLQAAKNWRASPSNLFNSSFLAIALLTAAFKVLRGMGNTKDLDRLRNAKEDTKPEYVKDLQIKFLSVFWLLRCADWLQGPYFYEVYASKIFNGVPVSIALISRLFLTGFASTALFGPVVGRAVDLYGRKRGTIAFSFIYAIGAISTKSPLLLVLFLGRIFSGIGTSLLFSAPESWLVAESQKDGNDPNGKYLGETFGLVRIYHATDQITLTAHVSFCARKPHTTV
jgi:Sugar-tranasporters, 12 TM